MYKLIQQQNFSEQTYVIVDLLTGDKSTQFTCLMTFFDAF